LRKYFFLLLFLLQGCVPVFWPSQVRYRPLNLRIVGETSNAPLSGVTAYLEDAPEIIGVSDDKGMLTLEGVSGWDYFSCLPLAPAALAPNFLKLPIVLRNASTTRVVEAPYFTYYIGWDFCGDGELTPVFETHVEVINGVTRARNQERELVVQLKE
jgi:hypothetical protein